MHHLGTRKTNGHPITIPLDQRFQSVYAIGQTGTGKSTFLKTGFLQDVYNGYGACYFDFHGQDAAWLLDHIPPERLDDVVYINPLNPAGVIGFNPLDGVRAGEDEQATAEIVASLKHIFADSWGGRMDDILTNAVRPLFHLPYENKTTLLGAIRMLNDPAYRAWVLKHCKERAVLDFWHLEYANWTKGEQNGNVNSTLNKIRRFQAAPILRRIFGQPNSRIDLRRAVADGKLLIFDFNKPRMGAVNASVMGALFLSRLIHEATTRARPMINGEVVTGALKPFMFHIDEFHSIMSSATAMAFSEGRKFRIGITCAHQFTRQLTATTPGRQVFDAIMGNVGTKLVFRVGGDDATELFRAMEVAEPMHLSELPDYNFMAYLKQDKSMTRERGITSLPEFPRHGYAASILRRTTADWCKPIAEIDADYERWTASRHYSLAADPGRKPAPKKVRKLSETQQAPKDTVAKKKSGQMRAIGAIMRDRFVAE